jgi:hypothetical protein
MTSDQKKSEGEFSAALLAELAWEMIGPWSDQSRSSEFLSDGLVRCEAISTLAELPH